MQRTASLAFPLRTASLLAALLVVWSFLPTAAAQPSSAADRYFDDGRKALAEGRYADACRLFASSQELDPSVGTLLNLGECSTKQGHYVEARVHLAAAQALATSRGDSERAVYAKQQYEALGDRVGTLQVAIDPRISNPLVIVDGQPLSPEALVAGRVELTRGSHSVVLRSGGIEVSTHEVEIGEATTMLSLAPKTTVSHDLVTPSSPTGPTSASATTGSSSRKRSKTGLYVAIGGAAVFAGGVGLAFSAKSSYDDAKRAYDDSPSDGALADIDAARDRGDLATIISIAGLATVATGTTIYLLSGKKAPSTEMAFIPTAGGAAAVVSGRF